MIVGLENLRVACSIGVYPEEKGRRQELLVNLQVEADVPSSDLLANTIDYDRLAAICQETASMRHYDLIESLAQAIMQKIFDELTVYSVEITIKKTVPYGTAFVTLNERLS